MPRIWRTMISYNWRKNLMLKASPEETAEMWKLESKDKGETDMVLKPPKEKLPKVSSWYETDEELGLDRLIPEPEEAPKAKLNETVGAELEKLIGKAKTAVSAGVKLGSSGETELQRTIIASIVYSHSNELVDKALDDLMGVQIKADVQMMQKHLGKVIEDGFDPNALLEGYRKMSEAPTAKSEELKKKCDNLLCSLQKGLAAAEEQQRGKKDIVNETTLGQILREAGADLPDSVVKEAARLFHASQVEARNQRLIDDVKGKLAACEELFAAWVGDKSLLHELMPQLDDSVRKQLDEGLATLRGKLPSEVPRDETLDLSDLDKACDELDLRLREMIDEAKSNYDMLREVLQGSAPAPDMDIKSVKAYRKEVQSLKNENRIGNDEFKGLMDVLNLESQAWATPEKREFLKDVFRAASDDSSIQDSLLHFQIRFADEYKKALADIYAKPGSLIPVNFAADMLNMCTKADNKWTLHGLRDIQLVRESNMDDDLGKKFAEAKEFASQVALSKLLQNEQPTVYQFADEGEREKLREKYSNYLGEVLNRAEDAYKLFSDLLSFNTEDKQHQESLLTDLAKKMFNHLFGSGLKSDEKALLKVVLREVRHDLVKEAVAGARADNKNGKLTQELKDRIAQKLAEVQKAKERTASAV